MPKVYLRTVMAGPDGVRHPGWHDIDDETAAALLAGGFAVPAASDAVETASVEAPETGAMPRPSRRRG